jgi:hypothetical protein
MLRKPTCEKSGFYKTSWENGISGIAKMFGALAQLGERLLCTQEVSGSIPLGSTNIILYRSCTQAAIRGCIGNAVDVQACEGSNPSNSATFIFLYKI